MKRGIEKSINYLTNLILIWSAIAFYRTNDYYVGFLRHETQTIILSLAIAYTLFGFIYHLKLSSTKTEKPIKTSILFMLVKIFFLPIMLNFTINNFSAFKNQFSQISLSSIFSVYGFNTLFFPLALTAIFLVDTLWFSFGYAFEAGFLKNTIRSVEPTILGWVVALICYPPFNSFTVKYINWYANDYILFSTPSITFALRIIILLLLGVYVSATLALGTKCSNLTNRGIVSRGPYAIIRHPAYISKNLAWWLTILPIASIPAVLSMGAWSLIYHIRTLTEENHLGKDLDYIKYKKKVKWRYVPRVY